MDRSTREHVRRQIDAAVRRKEGLAQRKVTKAVQKPAGSKGKRWTDGEITRAVELCADELGVHPSDLKQSQYRNWRERKKTALPNTQTVQSRLPVRLA